MCVKLNPQLFECSGSKVKHDRRNVEVVGIRPVVSGVVLQQKPTAFHAVAHVTALLRRQLRLLGLDQGELGFVRFNTPFDRFGTLWREAFRRKRRHPALKVIDNAHLVLVSLFVVWARRVKSPHATKRSFQPQNGQSLFLHSSQYRPTGILPLPSLPGGLCAARVAVPRCAVRCVLVPSNCLEPICVRSSKLDATEPDPGFGIAIVLDALPVALGKDADAFEKQAGIHFESSPFWACAEVRRERIARMRVNGM